MRQWPDKYNVVSFYLKLRRNKKKWQDCSISTKNKKAIHSPIISGSGSFRGRFGDHFRVGDHFGVGIISGAVQAWNHIFCNVQFWWSVAGFWGISPFHPFIKTFCLWICNRPATPLLHQSAFWLCGKLKRSQPEKRSHSPCHQESITISCHIFNRSFVYKSHSRPDAFIYNIFTFYRLALRI